jgi:hypothetical protein
MDLPNQEANPPILAEGRRGKISRFAHFARPWMNALYRCAIAVFVALGGLASVQVRAQAQGQAALPTLPQAPTPVPRKFSQNTLRGSITFGDYPQVSLNGQLTRLAPGGRLRNQRNLVISAAPLTGQSAVVNYTLDLGGNQVRDVWILRPEELAVTPWPTTPNQALTWTFNPVSQTWTPP